MLCVCPSHPFTPLQLVSWRAALSYSFRLERQQPAGSELQHDGRLIENCMTGLEAWFDAANEGAEDGCDADLMPLEDPGEWPAVQIFLGKAGDAVVGMLAEATAKASI